SARELLVLGQLEMAEAAWHRVIENQGSVVWPAHVRGIGDADFLAEFTALDVRLYRRARVLESAASADAYWAALGGCLDPALHADVTVPWLAVRALEAEPKGTLVFRLKEPMTVDAEKKSQRLTRLELTLLSVAGGSDTARRASDSDAVRRVLTKF